MHTDLRLQQVPSGVVPYDPGLEGQVQRGLNLVLRLKSPAQMPALIRLLKREKPVIDLALTSLNYVHFARFLPMRDGSALLVITEFDGEMKSYIMDFVAVMGDAFTAILDYVQDAPRLPVQKYPDDFWKFVLANHTETGVFSAYSNTTVIEIVRAFESR